MRTLTPKIESNTDKKIKSTLQAVIDFESRIKQALEFKYRHDKHKNTLVDSELKLEIDLKNFSSLYFSKNIYPKDRFPKIISYLMDIKIQSLFLMIDHAQYNHLIYNPHQGIDIRSNPRLLLLHLYLDQNVIIKSRILFERWMNAIYFLETGEDIEIKVKNKSKKSKKTFFWHYIKKEKPKWSFLLEYENFFDSYDNLYRTPEVHSCSTLRSHFINSKLPDPDIISAIYNIFLNIKKNIYTIVKGETVQSKYWCIGIEKNSD